MELVIDNLFKESYKLYFENFRTEDILEKVNDVFNHYEPDVLTDAVNIAKTSMALNMTYTECYDKIGAAILHRFPVSDDIDKFIMSVVVKIMIAMDAESLGELVRRTRDIHKEVTAKHFRVPMARVTGDMMASMQAAADNFMENNYVITDPPVDGWDDYFYSVCRQIARNSKCFSKRIGAALVRDKGIISTGYNGPPRGVPRCDLRWRLDPVFADKYLKQAKGKQKEGKCPRYILGFTSGQGLDICPAGHAERNALINAARYGICTKDTILYMTCGIPCSPCLVEIINAGVKEIVVTSLKLYDETSIYLLNQSNLSVRMYDFIK